MSQSPICKYCRSKKVTGYGRGDNRPRLRCAECKRTFLDNGSPPRMRHTAGLIGQALHRFYSGESAYKLEASLSVDHSTIYRWITKYTAIAFRVFGQVVVQSGSTWVVIETIRELRGGRRILVWDCIDTDSWFLLASYVACERSREEVSIFMGLARMKGAGYRRW